MATITEDQRDGGGGAQDDARQEAQWPHSCIPLPGREAGT